MTVGPQVVLLACGQLSGKVGVASNHRDLGNHSPRLGVDGDVKPRREGLYPALFSSQLKRRRKGTEGGGIGLGSKGSEQKGWRGEEPSSAIFSSRPGVDFWVPDANA